uniref:Uncharacterized protein n=1 Tax=Steinernema glaseri TaxID=37863 RepID=A0A1I7ZYX2_9BILA
MAFCANLYRFRQDMTTLRPLQCFESDRRVCSRVRVVKEIDSKSIGLCPRSGSKGYPKKVTKRTAFSNPKTAILCIPSRVHRVKDVGLRSQNQAVVPVKNQHFTFHVL